MPYRAMFFTIITVAIALLALTLWISAVAPLVPHGAAAPPAASAETSPERGLAQLFKGTLLLSFLLICLLLVVGFAATFREWVRVHTMARDRKTHQTKYVDAWKVAGERLQPPKPDENGERP